MLRQSLNNFALHLGTKGKPRRASSLDSTTDQLILGLIQDADGWISREELEDQTGMSESAIKKRLRGLKEDRLVHERRMEGDRRKREYRSTV